ncbi:M10 family metallopeptidase C-terminal domain-containing protein [Microvirga sp. GCM10011540]|uniref:M10 family metallopeptidase C-terminal domain-containing protein n=1 Tax=Microvirga sp. GCM10011540 TaxID=3317338 RepID=UPI003617B273
MPAVTKYALTGNAYINGVLGDYKWAASSFTFSFPVTGSAYGTSYGEGENTTNFSSFTMMQQAATHSILDMYASVALLRFTQISETATQHADLRFAMSDKPGTAWAYFPSTTAEAGDAWFNNSSGAYHSPTKGNYAYLTVVHEIGHALGLEHAHEHFVMPQDRDSMEYTVMSYRSYVGASTTSGYVNEGWGYAQSLMMYDIAALQHMYGANYSTNSGNTTYSWSPTTGEMFVNGTGQGAPGGNRIFQTVWDGGGTDTYDFSNYTTGLTIDLQPGAWTKTTAGQLAKLQWDGSRTAAGNIANAHLYNDDPRSLIENASGGWAGDVITGNIGGNTLCGGGGNDTIYGGLGGDRIYGNQDADFIDGGDDADALFGGQGSDTVYGGHGHDWIEGNKEDDLIFGNQDNDSLFGGAGNDSLYGGQGNDILQGGVGQDLLVGGVGQDVFVFVSPADSAGLAIDTVADFQMGLDRINLQQIDANSVLAGDQAFLFIGQSGFTGMAGELHFSNGVLCGDINGDRVADFQIFVQGLSALTAGDFYL